MFDSIRPLTAIFLAPSPETTSRHLNLRYCGNTKSSMRRDVSCKRSVYFIGKLTMKLFGSSVFGQALAAARVGAALILSVGTSHAQAGCALADFDGNLSGTGTVAICHG